MVVKNEGTGKHEGLEKLMLKIGVFSSLYLVSHFFPVTFSSDFSN